MKTAAIISEFNPFHSGHRLLIDKTREAGATHIVSVMSGNFVQRGDVAVFDKFTRAKLALQNGVDLVIELPERISLTSAEGFAKGAVEIISALGCVDMLAFGSESGDLAALREASGAIDYAVHTDYFSERIKRGKSYPAALDAALREYYTPDVAETVESPNNTLAIEYLNALDNIGSSIEPFTVKRLGARHDSELSDSEASETASASAIRKLILAGGDYSSYAPTTDAPTADLPRLERAILAKLRTMSVYDFDNIYDCANGLGNRLYKAVRGASTLSELYFLTKTKRYTLARIRRAVLCGFLGIDKHFSLEKSAYIRVLGMNTRGREILSAAAEANCQLPIDTSLKALAGKSRDAARQANFTARCTDLYGLAFERPKACGADFTTAPIIIE